jgi:hypothetical protein
LLVNILRGASSAILDFLVIGIAVPYAVEYFAPTISSYIALPPPSEIWGVFLLFGVLLAATGFLQRGYSKGDFPWLAGKIGGGLVEFGIFYFLFLLLPKSLGGSGSSATLESTGLLVLVGLAFFFSYGYLILDFWDARRTKQRAAARPVDTGSPGARL